MDFKEYQAHFSKIVDGDDVAAPYDEPEYMDYTKLNWSRTNRWLKRGELDSDLKSLIESIDDAQEWLVITEPWCGDAAHSVPFIHMLADLNPKISLRVELRDQPPHSIDKYLTNGTKSIPKLVVRDASGKDLFTW